MPAQRPGRSRQDYETPREFLVAVERVFGPLKVDLASTPANAKAPARLDDSLAVPWPVGPLCWLNPPFARIGPWAAKCASSGARVLLLVPASVGANWYAEHVHGRALVLALQGRISFDGIAPFPKDCILAAYGFGKPGFEVWDWRSS
jgi:phage N-6-adenine-methyltransferase